MFKASFKEFASRVKRKHVGIFTSSLPSPDIANGGWLLIDVSGTLSNIMTALAPAFIALRALSTNVHSPRSMIAILPLISSLFCTSEHKWNGLTKTGEEVMGSSVSGVKCEGPA